MGLNLTLFGRRTLGISMKTIGLLSLVLLCLSNAAAAEENIKCEGRADIVNSCFTIRGRLSYSNGSPSARIWRVGTHRMLGIRNDELPKEIEDKMLNFDTELWGEFKVCPLTQEQPEHMQFVCIESWRNLKARQRN